MSDKKFFFKFVCEDHANNHAWSKDVTDVPKCPDCKSLMSITDERNEIKRKSNSEIIATAKRNEFKRNNPNQWMNIR